MIDPCTQCRIGRLHPITTAYLAMLEEQMLVVPDAPAAKCDMCSQIVYNGRFLHNMQKLIDQFNNPALINEQSQWQPPDSADGIDNSDGIDNAIGIIPTRRSS